MWHTGHPPNDSRRTTSMPSIMSGGESGVPYEDSGAAGTGIGECGEAPGFDKTLAARVSLELAAGRGFGRSGGDSFEPRTFSP